MPPEEVGWRDEWLDLHVKIGERIVPERLAVSDAKNGYKPINEDSRGSASSTDSPGLWSLDESLEDGGGVGRLDKGL